MHNFSLFFFLSEFIQKGVGYEFLSTKRRGTCFFLPICKLITELLIHVQENSIVAL
jgi:hypothetical protein